MRNQSVKDLFVPKNERGNFSGEKSEQTVETDSKKSELIKEEAVVRNITIDP